MATTAVNTRLSRHYTIDDPSDPDSCWNWTGALSSQGDYPGFTGDDGQFIYAHRCIYENSFGPIPAGYHVHHNCLNRTCIRPDHLEAVSPEEHRARHAVECTKRRIERGSHFLSLAATGLTTKQIGQIVGLSRETVRSYSREAALSNLGGCIKQ
jgi:hypothetical protein